MACAATASTTSHITMQQWADQRINAQKMLKPGDFLPEKISPELLDKSFPRWETNAAGEKQLGAFTLRHELQGRCVIVFLPGTHTPTCSNHLPLLVGLADRLHQLGVKILVVCVNRTDDMFVWAEKHDPMHKLSYIPDMTGEFTLAAGVGAWSARLGLMANRVAIVKNENNAVVDVLPELQDSQQCNARCVVTGQEIGDRVATIFA